MSRGCWKEAFFFYNTIIAMISDSLLSEEGFIWCLLHGTAVIYVLYYSFILFNIEIMAIENYYLIFFKKY